jgi:phage repressor protein C with HTH and peptisase S24 domain
MTLANISRDSYGILIRVDSMSPQIESGDTVYVDPHRPHRDGDTCVFQGNADDGSVTLCITELVREADDFWHVKQHTPKKSFRLKKSEWQVCHVIVGVFFGETV